LRERGVGRGALADLRSALDRVTRPPLATAVAALMLALLVVVVAGHIATLAAPSHGNIETGTGDFLAFWTGATMIHDGHGTALYEIAAQRELQARILGGASPELQPYLNPPLLALLLSPLVVLGYVRGFLVFIVACAMALAAGLAMLLRVLPAIRARAWGTWTLVFAIASFQPMLQTTFGGQNTPISFALLAALAASLRRGSTAGVALALGLLSYKPQYAVGIGAALLVGGCWRALAGAGAVAAAHWLAGTLVCGLAWPAQMLDFLRIYRPAELRENLAEHFSWVRTADFLFPSPLDTVLAVLGVVAIVALWWRYRALAREGAPAWTALAVTGTMLASPHEQYYDAALLVLPVALLVEHGLARDRSPSLAARIALAAVYVGYPLWEWAPTLGIQPLFLVLAALFAWSVSACREAAAAAPA
jgi:hypothetical protein